jgi:hypothetical protein
MPETHFDLDRSHIFSIDYARSTEGTDRKVITTFVGT